MFYGANEISIPNNIFFATSCSSNFNQTSLIEPENPNDADLLLTGVADPIEPLIDLCTQ